MNKVFQSAQDVISRFKSQFLTPDGLIARTFPVGDRTIFDNFDDVVPFFVYFEETKFLVDQVRKSRAIPLERLLGHNGIILSHKVDEYLGGLYAVHKAVNMKEKTVEDALTTAIRAFEEYFVESGDLLMAYDCSKRKSINVRTYWSSGLLETFLEMREDYPHLVPMTLDILNSWLDDPFFVEHGLFPFRVNPRRPLFNRFNNSIGFKNGRWNGALNKNVPIPGIGGRDWRYLFKSFCFEHLPSGNFVQLMKANSTMVFLLIEAYRLTGNLRYRSAIAKWIGSSDRHLRRRGEVFGYLDMSFNRYEATLTDAFIYIDVLCDAYYFVDKEAEYLRRAEEIARHWLNLQWANSLIPMYQGCTVDHIDNMVDFSVSLRRISELSGNDVYRNKAAEIINAVLRLHHGEAGFFTHVSEDGSVPGDGIVDPKYNALLLKGIINLLTMKEPIYGSSLHGLFKDR